MCAKLQGTCCKVCLRHRKFTFLRMRSEGLVTRWDGCAAVKTMTMLKDVLSVRLLFCDGCIVISNLTR